MVIYKSESIFFTQDYSHKMRVCRQKQSSSGAVSIGISGYALPQISVRDSFHHFSWWFFFLLRPSFTASMIWCSLGLCPDLYSHLALLLLWCCQAFLFLIISPVNDGCTFLTDLGLLFTFAFVRHTLAVIFAVHDTLNTLLINHMSVASCDLCIRLLTSCFKYTD